MDTPDAVRCTLVLIIFQPLFLADTQSICFHVAQSFWRAEMSSVVAKLSTGSVQAVQVSSARSIRTGVFIAYKTTHAKFNLRA